MSIVDPLGTYSYTVNDCQLVLQYKYYPASNFSFIMDNHINLVLHVSSATPPRNYTRKMLNHPGVSLSE